MSALLESLSSQFESLAQREQLGLGDARREALQSALAHGLPTQRQEAWKYTSLRALAQRSYVLSSAGDSQASTEIGDALLPPSPRLVFVNGRYSGTHSDLGGLPDGVSMQPLSQALAADDPRQVNMLARRWEGDDAALWQLNAALAVDGCVLRVEAGTIVESPLHLVFIGTLTTQDIAAHLRHRVEVREDASVTLVEHHLSTSEQTHLNNHVSHLHLKPRARLRHVRLQDGSAADTQFARTEAVLAADADYRLHTLELGAALSRHDIGIDLQGRKAHAAVRGLVCSDHRQHIDSHLVMRHQIGDCTSDTQWRAIASGRSRVVFHGGIHIAAGADGSDAALQTRNLLLSETAEIDAQPVLVIDAEEVKAAHGATVGQLDEMALYYLRSRGLPEDAARQLLVYAFCQSLLDDIEHDALREQLAEQVKARLFDDAEARA